MLDDGECTSRENTVPVNGDVVVPERSEPVLDVNDLREVDDGEDGGSGGSGGSGPDITRITREIANRGAFD